MVGDHAPPGSWLPLFKEQDSSYAALGLLWGWMYLRSGNLLAIMLIHALWNTRIFIGSLVQIVS